MWLTAPRDVCAWTAWSAESRPDGSSAVVNPRWGVNHRPSRMMMRQRQRTDTAASRPGDQLRGAAVRLRLGGQPAESLMCLRVTMSRARRWLAARFRIGAVYGHDRALCGYLAVCCPLIDSSRSAHAAPHWRKRSKELF